MRDWACVRVMSSLVACHECDLLQREIALASGATARCVRCKGFLYRDHPHGLDRALAFASAAAILFVVANSFPLVGLEVNGELIETTLFGAARSLYAGGMKTLGAVVLITTVVAPLVELIAILGLLLPLRFGRRAPYSARLFRAFRAIQPWRMVEVMMLGVLVALVKLAHMAAVIPGIAMWALASVVILLAACLSAFDPRLVWAQFGAARS
jgi:paraquat-inducible protein A